MVGADIGHGLVVRLIGLDPAIIGFVPSGEIRGAFFAPLAEAQTERGGEQGEYTCRGSECDQFFHAYPSQVHSTLITPYVRIHATNSLRMASLSCKYSIAKPLSGSVSSTALSSWTCSSAGTPGLWISYLYSRAMSDSYSHEGS